MTQSTFETRSHSLTYGDYAAYAFHTFYRNLLTVKAGLFHLVITVLLILSFGLPPLIRGDVAGALPGTLGYPAFVLIAGPCLFGARILWAARTIPAMRAARTVIFSPDALTINRNGLDVTLGWGTFRTVFETPKAIYLMRTSEAHIVPKSTFASADTGKLAAAHARHHVKYATDKSTKVFYDTPVPAPPTADEQVSPPFELNFRLFAEIFLRNRYHSLGALLGQLSAAVAMSLFYAWIYRIELMEGQYTTFLLSSLGFTALIFIAPVLALPLSWKLSQKVPTVMGQRRVAITPTYVRTFGEGYDTRFAWRDLRRVVRTRKGLACYTMPRGVTLVPASAFASQAEADAFFDQAKAWADAARAK